MLLFLYIPIFSIFGLLPMRQHHIVTGPLKLVDNLLSGRFVQQEFDSLMSTREFEGVRGYQSCQYPRTVLGYPFGPFVTVHQ